MHALSPRRSAGFSLIELVIVVVIIGIIGAIAIPRLSRGAAGANDSALVGDLAVLRNAIDLYATEHGGTYPTVADIADQLTQYTDAAGATSATKTTTHIYGPYIRKIPAATVGTRPGATGFAAADAVGIGWLYNATTGEITVNATTETDSAGKTYVTY
ncbi:MAG: type II secretion system protein [Phycisphaerales bacterium JB063]